MNPAKNPAPENRTNLYLHLLTGWHALLCLVFATAILMIWRSQTLATWVRLLGTVVLVLGIVGSAVSVFAIRQRKHRGRVLSLAINYLGFLACFLYGLQILGIFTGIDALAGTFGRGVPFMVGILVGYLISAFGDRYQNYPAKQKFYQRSGKIIMAIFGVVTLFFLGIVPGIIALLKRFDNPLPFILVVGTLLFGLAIWAMWRQPTADAMGANNAHAEMLSGYLFLSPNLLGFLFFFAGPLLLSFYTSFTNWDAFGTREWIGLDNYAKIFSLDFVRLENANQPFPEVLDTTKFVELARFSLFGSHFLIGAADKLFWLALRNTVVFSLMAVPLSVIPALLLANLLNSKLPGMKAFRAIYFLPSIAAVVGIALIWQWLYNAAVGYINYAITSVVNLLNSIPGIMLIDPQVRWLSDTNTALLAVVIMSAWQWIGFNTVLFLAGLQNIPGELYEAATVDGAGKWAKFWNVTLPLLAPTTFFVITTAIISALQLFEQVYVLIPTEPPGGPNNSTLSLVLYLYQKGFQRFEQGYASAVAWVLFVAIFGVTLLQYLRQRRSTAYTG
ncbi:MAG TPA: sugar ABC transporter permease [Anaerolineales bacterium]|nr:sugar ABC transporter permease [Anaerolineales bacterium]